MVHCVSIDRVNILDVLNLKLASDIMEKFSIEKPNQTDRLHEP